MDFFGPETHEMKIIFPTNMQYTLLIMGLKGQNILNKYYNCKIEKK